MIKRFVNYIVMFLKQFFTIKQKSRFKRKLTISRNTFHQHTPLKSQPKRPPRNHPKPDWVITEVIRLKALLGNGAGCRIVANTFNRLHEHSQTRPMTVGKSFVADVIKKHQYRIATERRDIRNKQPRNVAVNDTWAMDVSFYKTIDKQLQPCLGILDHGSRYVMSLNTLVNRKSWTILGYLCLAIGKYGKPNKVRTDNEMIFNSYAFKTLLKLADIKHQKTQVAAPWQNGRVERLFGTLKPILKQLVIRDSASLKYVLTEFRWFYNHIRTHQNLQGKTPNEVFNKIDTTKPMKQATVVNRLDGLLKGVKIKR